MCSCLRNMWIPNCWRMLRDAVRSPIVLDALYLWSSEQRLQIKRSDSWVFHRAAGGASVSLTNSSLRASSLPLASGTLSKDRTFSRHRGLHVLTKYVL